MHWIQLILDTDQLQGFIDTGKNLRNIYMTWQSLTIRRQKKSLCYAQILNSHRTQNTVPPVERPFSQCCMEKQYLPTVRTQRNG